MSHRPADVPPRSPIQGRLPATQTFTHLAPRAASAMSKSAVEMPGQQALIDRSDLPEGSVASPDNSGADRCESFAEWRADAAPYFILRAAEPGRFTAFDCIRDAPLRIRNPRSDKWPGILMAQLHHEGIVEHAMAFGLRLFDTSHRPESGGSAVSVWVGVEAQQKAAAA